MKANTPVRKIAEILHQFIWEPGQMFYAIGDRYRQVTKAQAAVEGFRAGFRAGLLAGAELERNRRHAD